VYGTEHRSSVTWVTDGHSRSEGIAMPRPTRRSVAGRNRLLAALPADERERVLLHCRPVVLANERVLVAPGEEVRYAYFPTDGVVALLMIMEDGTPVEVATVGTEGFVSVESILSTNVSPYEVTCQTPVEALRIDVRLLRAAFRESGPLRDQLLRYAAVVFSCTGRSLACKVTHPVEQRLARWLLMTHDRIRGEDLPLTQDTLARMLGVHRPTISEAADALRQRDLITYHRGHVAITDRAGLEATSCEHYAEFRAVYDQLFGPAADADQATL
jgi:CRP-like cAMP-binding protein